MTQDDTTGGKRPRAVVTGHATLPEGLVAAVAQITGRGAWLLPLSNAGLGREEIEAQLRDAVERYGIGVVFTDLPAGSATLAARRVMHEVPGLTLVTGVNLAVLLDFVFSDVATPAAEAARHAAEKGRAALSSSIGH